MRAAAIAAALAAACAAASAAADSSELEARAYSDFLGGDLPAAAAAYRSLGLTGSAAGAPDANLALLRRDLGEPEAALAHWIKASVLEGADGFVWAQRGWASLALDKPREAREAFLRAVDRSTSPSSLAESHLGLGLAALADSRPKLALEALREALGLNPYTLPIVLHHTGSAASALKERQLALTYLRQALSLDPLNAETLRALADQYRRVGDPASAWRANFQLLVFDPLDPEAGKDLRRAAKILPGDPAKRLPVRRLARPLLDPEGKGQPPPAASSETLRVALFADARGKAATATRLYFMTNAPFRVVAQSGEVVKETARGYDQWEIQFRPENNLIELRDAVRTLQYTTKLPFRIEPGSRRGSVLLKSAEFVESYGFDPGDRELRGALDVYPTPYGFKLANEVFLEDYLFGAVSASLPAAGPAEAVKALAVTARSLALWLKAHGEENLERTHVCDSAHCLPYVGLNSELLQASHAVARTEGALLTLNGRPARTALHAHCGGRTERPSSPPPGLEHLASVVDGPRAFLRDQSPAGLERWLHEAPEPGSFCEAAAAVPSSAARWVRVIDARHLRERAERFKDIGPLRHLRVLRRSQSGRVSALEAAGARDVLILEGESAVADFISPGSLRSTLFSIQPLLEGSRPARFLVWGAGTGSGQGLCLAGAVGQAGLGRTWREILRHYFPGLVVFPPEPPARVSIRRKAAGPPASSPAGRKRKLNPRRRPR